MAFPTNDSRSDSIPTSPRKAAVAIISSGMMIGSMPTASGTGGRAPTFGVSGAACSCSIWFSSSASSTSGFQ